MAAIFFKGNICPRSTLCKSRGNININASSYTELCLHYLIDLRVKLSAQDYYSVVWNSTIGKSPKPEWCQVF